MAPHDKSNWVLTFRQILMHFFLFHVITFSLIIISTRPSNDLTFKRVRISIQFNSIQFYLYSAFYNTGLSQSSFTKGPGLRPPQSKPRATVARKNSLTSRKKPWAEPGFGGGAVCFRPALGRFITSSVIEVIIVPQYLFTVSQEVSCGSLVLRCTWWNWSLGFSAH